MTATLPASEVLSRQKCLDNLDEYINQCQGDITSMLDELGWTPSHFVQPKTRSTCPYNCDHVMPASSLAKHTPLCELVSRGCTREEAEAIVEDTGFAYQGATCVYTEKIDINSLNAVLWNHHVKNNSVFYGYKEMPLTADQEEQMLTREDRLGLAEFIVNKAKEAKRLKELGQDELQISENLADLVRKEDDKRQLDHVEELAAIRDYRRRRQTYRAKNVHITKKSHTEIVREVITNQMEMYAKSLKEKFDDEEADKDDASKLESGGRNRYHEQTSRDHKYRENRSQNYNRDNQNSGSHKSDSMATGGTYRTTHTTDREDKHDRANEAVSMATGHTHRSTHTTDREDSYSQSDRSEYGERQRSRKRSVSQEQEKRHSKDKRRSRSRSRSTDRHKKQKHKKHKHKHKHKHRGSDTEGKASSKSKGQKDLDESDETSGVAD